jgi:hypothetical protein
MGPIPFLMKNFGGPTEKMMMMMVMMMMIVMIVMIFLGCCMPRQRLCSIIVHSLIVSCSQGERSNPCHVMENRHILHIQDPTVAPAKNLPWPSKSFLHFI